MRVTLRSGDLSIPLTVEQCKDRLYVSAFFESKEDAENFFASLPKWVKARCRNLPWTGFASQDERRNHCGLKWHPIPFARALPGISRFDTYEVSILLARTGKVTGPLNEQGERRRQRFLESLTQSYEVVPDLNV